jgi:hypothetical protein
MENIYNFPPDSPRFQQAISRINYIHSRYPKISADSMLYTLCVFAVNPWDYVDKDEWRRLNVLEVAALGTFWMKTGELLHCDLTPIKGMAITHPVSNGRKDLAPYTSESIESWRDGYDFMLDLRAYMRWHETEYAQYSKDVDALVSTSFEVVTKYIPTAYLRSLVQELLMCEFPSMWYQAMG